jgi:hypothetical protein
MSKSHSIIGYLSSPIRNILDGVNFTLRPVGLSMIFIFFLVPCWHAAKHAPVVPAPHCGDNSTKPIANLMSGLQHCWVS